MMDTFLQPLIDDLKVLATTGIPAVRWDNDQLVKFTMRAHLVVVSGDMPAISKVRSNMNTEDLQADYLPMTLSDNALQGDKQQSPLPMLYIALNSTCQGCGYHVLSLHRRARKDTEAISIYRLATQGEPRHQEDSYMAKEVPGCNPQEDSAGKTRDKWRG